MRRKTCGRTYCRIAADLVVIQGRGLVYKQRVGTVLAPPPPPGRRGGGGGVYTIVPCPGVGCQAKNEKK